MRQRTILLVSVTGLALISAFYYSLREWRSGYLPRREKEVRKISQLDEGRREIPAKLSSRVPAREEAGMPSSQAIARAKEENEFLFLYFYENGSDESDRMRTVINEAKERWRETARFAEIDIHDSSEREILDTYGIYRAPTTLVMAPNGVIVAGFPGAVTMEDLEHAFVSPKTAEFIEALQQRKVTFLCIQNDGSKNAKEVMNAVSNVAEVLGKSVKVIIVDPSDESEEGLLKRIQVDPAADEAVTMVISQQGSIGDRFTGKVSSRQLFAAFKKVIASRSGCGGMGKESCE